MKNVLLIFVALLILLGAQPVNVPPKPKVVLIRTFQDAMGSTAEANAMLFIHRKTSEGYLVKSVSMAGTQSIVHVMVVMEKY